MLIKTFFVALTRLIMALVRVVLSNLRNQKKLFTESKVFVLKAPFKYFEVNGILFSKRKVSNLHDE